MNQKPFRPRQNLLHDVYAHVDDTGTIVYIGETGGGRARAWSEDARSYPGHKDWLLEQDKTRSRFDLVICLVKSVSKKEALRQEKILQWRHKPKFNKEWRDGYGARKIKEQQAIDVWNWMQENKDLDRNAFYKRAKEFAVEIGVDTRTIQNVWSGKFYYITDNLPQDVVWSDIKKSSYKLYDLSPLERQDFYDRCKAAAFGKEAEALALEGGITYIRVLQIKRGNVKPVSEPFNNRKERLPDIYVKSILNMHKNNPEMSMKEVAKKHPKATYRQVGTILARETYPHVFADN